MNYEEVKRAAALVARAEELNALREEYQPLMSTTDITLEGGKYKLKVSAQSIFRLLDTEHHNVQRMLTELGVTPYERR